MSADTADVTAEADDELKSALLAAFGDDAMSLLDEEEPTLLPGLTVSEQDSPKLRWVKDLTRSIYTDRLTHLGLIAQAPTSSESNSDDQPRWIVFAVGAQRFAVPLLEAREIVLYPRITRLPRMPEWLRGVVNVRGKILSVIHLCALLEMQIESSTIEKRIIVLESPSRRISLAIEVDHMIGLRTLGQEEMKIDDIPRSFPLVDRQIIEVDNQDTLLIHTDKLLDLSQIK